MIFKMSILLRTDVAATDHLINTGPVPMGYPQSRKKAIELLFAVNGAITNIRLYPPESHIIQSAVLRIYRQMTEILSTEGTLGYAEADGKLFVQEEFLGEKEQHSPHVRNFTAMMTNHRIRSIVFEQGLSEKELAVFMQALAKAPEAVREAGGLAGRVQDQGIVHIRLDEKIYVEVDKADHGNHDQAKGYTGERAGEQSRISGREAAGANFKTALNRIIASDYAVFTESAAAQMLPGAFIQLAGAGKKQVVEALIKGMEDAITRENIEIRRSVAKILSDTDEKLEISGYTGLRLEIARMFSRWLAVETEAVPELERAGSRVANLARRLIRTGRREKAAGIIEAWHKVAAGSDGKNRVVRERAEKMLRHLADDEVMELLMKDSEKAGESERKRVINSLSILGAINADKLLDRLRDSRSMPERNRIIQAIGQVGPAAVPTIVERLGQDGPWYFIRNLVMLLGRLGNEQHLPLLEEHLMNPDYRVQREAIKSIQSLGGEAAGRMLHEHFDDVEEQLKPYVVSAIGAMRYEKAIPWLIRVLSEKSGGKNRPEYEEIREKACEALGRMRAEEAVSALESIIRKKGFWEKKSPENVRFAAARALAEIKRG